MTTPPGEGRNEAERDVPLPTLLTRAKDIAVDKLHQRLAEEGFAGIRYVHGSVFRFIDAEGSRLTMLAERSGLTKQAIGELVTELQRQGYVERVADPGDQRAKIIRLTEQGRMAQAAAGRILNDTERRWSQSLGEDRITTLRSILAEVVDLENGDDSGRT